MTRAQACARMLVLGGEVKKTMVEERGGATFIELESGGWPVHAPCLKEADTTTEVTLNSTEIIIFNIKE